MKFKKLFKIILISLASLILLAYIVIFVIPQVYLVPITKYNSSKAKTPSAYIMPQNIDLSKIKDYANVYEINSLGIKFKSPWGNPVETIKKSENISTFKFDGDKSINIFFHGGGFGILNELKDNSYKVYQLFQKYEPESLQSEYIFFKNVYKSNPDKLTIFTSKGKATLDCFRISYKYILISENARLGIFDNSKFRGFQTKLNLDSDSSIIDIFDNFNNWYDMRVSGGNVTQDEINYIINSLDYSEKK